MLRLQCSNATGSLLIVSEELTAQIVDLMEEILNQPASALRGGPTTGLISIFVALNLCEETHIYGFYPRRGFTDPLTGRTMGVPYSYWQQSLSGDKTDEHWSHSYHDYEAETAIIDYLVDNRLIHRHL